MTKIRCVDAARDHGARASRESDPLCHRGVSLMKSRRLKTIAPVGLSAVALLLAPYAHGQTQAEQTPDEIAARLQMLKQQVEQQTRQLDALKRSVAEQEASLNDVRRAVAKEVLATQRGGQAASGAAPAPAAQQAQQA
ncbi:MAG TPA: hypothetical protein PLO41_19075, partial [Rubrivivax sp.]|nr:hypothetical protein [Rubrivivax sp.]